jgi:DNA replication protein DnaC
MLPSFNKYAKIIQQLEHDEGYSDFLLKLMKSELDDRQQTAQERRIKNAKFPVIKTIAEFDAQRLEHVSEGCIRQLASCDFIGKRQNVIMVGNPGSGKTHLATALGICACSAGFKVRFCTASTLATELSEALQESRLSRLEKTFSKYDLLIIDELSYLTFNRSQSELLFQVISERSERASVIITTNLEFSQWTQLFENEMMVAALVDRVTFNSQILNMNCTTSFRMEASLSNELHTSLIE